MKHILIGVLCALVSGSAFAQGGFGPLVPPVSVMNVAPSATSDGKLTITTTMTDGSQRTDSTPTPINVITVTAYDPSTYSITNGSTTQLRDGFGVFMLSGSGVILAATVRLPANRVDKQLSRVVLLPGLSVTTLTVQDSSGTVVGVLSSVVSGASPLYQYQGSTWVKIGS